MNAHFWNKLFELIRILIRALETVQQIMTEEICTADIIERCRKETGLDIVGGGWCE